MGEHVAATAKEEEINRLSHSANGSKASGLPEEQQVFDYYYYITQYLLRMRMIMLMRRWNSLGLIKLTLGLTELALGLTKLTLGLTKLGSLDIRSLLVRRLHPFLLHIRLDLVNLDPHHRSPHILGLVR